MKQKRIVLIDANLFDMMFEKSKKLKESIVTELFASSAVAASLEMLEDNNE
ncbi:hypothetical protein ACFSTH_05915 [Paenibacillus yanchengensis]